MNPSVPKLARKTKIPGCCDSFNQHVNKLCEKHGWECPDNTVRFYTTYKGTGTFGIPHPDGMSYIEIHFCPWCGAPLQPILANAADGLIQYTVVTTDGFGFVGIVQNSDIRWGKMGMPYFPKYLPEDKFPELFNVTFKELFGEEEDFVLTVLRERCPQVQFDTHYNV